MSTATQDHSEDYGVYMLLAEGSSWPPEKAQGNRATYVGMTNNLLDRVAKHNAGRVTETSGRHWHPIAWKGGLTRRCAAVFEAWLKCGDSYTKRSEFRRCSELEEPDRSEQLQLLILKAHLWSIRRNIKTSLESQATKGKSDAI